MGALTPRSSLPLLHSTGGSATAGGGTVNYPTDSLGHVTPKQVIGSSSGIRAIPAPSPGRLAPSGNPTLPPGSLPSPSGPTLPPGSLPSPSRLPKQVVGSSSGIRALPAPTPGHRAGSYATLPPGSLPAQPRKPGRRIGRNPSPGTPRRVGRRA